MVYTYESKTGEKWNIWGVKLYIRGGKETTAYYMLPEGRAPSNHQHGKPRKAEKLPENYTIFEYPNGTPVIRKA